MLTKKKQHLEIFQADKVLCDIIRQVELPVFQSTENVFHDVMSCIIEQQIHYRSTKNTFAHLLRDAGVEYLTPFNFYDVEPHLKNLRLSAAKYEAMANAIDYFPQTEGDWTALEDEEVEEHLTSVAGIGGWTAKMILLYTLKRQNVFPEDDYHLKQIMTRLYSIDPKKGVTKKMNEIATQWNGLRSVPVLYLFEWKKQTINSKIKTRNA